MRRTATNIEIDRPGPRPTPGAPQSGAKGAAPGPAPLPIERIRLFSRRVTEADSGLLVDEILPPGTLLECVSVDVLNCYINYVELGAVITERDPEEDDRYISISNRFYTHFHEFGTVIHVVASSPRHWWYFCYDIDASDCTIGRLGREECTLQQITDWVREERVSRKYPVVEIDIRKLQGWRSFQ